MYKWLTSAVLLLSTIVGCYSETLVFSDEFDTLDFRKWVHELTMGGGGNWEFEMYVNNRSVSYVENSVLNIKPQLTSSVLGAAAITNGGSIDMWGSQPSDSCTGNAFYGCSRSSGNGNLLNPIQSARLRTAETFSFRYGRVEFRAKMPRGDWLWPAVWMLPKVNQYGLWPASGEIDILESRGNDASYPNPPGGCNTFGSTIHYGPYAAMDGWSRAHEVYTLPSGDFTTDFHVFGLIWNTTNIITYVDSPDNIVLNVAINQSFYDLGQYAKYGLSNPWRGAELNAPYDTEFYLILNVAAGGVSGYFPDGAGNKPWSDHGTTAVNDFWSRKDTWFPSWQNANSAMQIDWIRVYQDL